MAVLTSNLLLVGAGVLALALVADFIYQHVVVYRRLRHIPGPPGVGWHKWWMASRQFSGKMCFHLKAAGEEYGPLIRIGPNFLACSDPFELRRIWGVRSGYERSPWYKGFRFDPNNDNVVTMNDNKRHHALRTKLLPGYQGKGLVAEQEAIIDTHVTKYLALLERRYLSSRSDGVRPLDLAMSLLFFTQDVTSHVGFGKPFGYLDADADFYGAIHALASTATPIQVMAMFPSVLRLVASDFGSRFLPKPTDKTGVGRVLGLIAERAAARYDAQGHVAERKVDDILQRFVESGLSRHEVEAEAFVLLIAGTDTTAQALRMAVFYIAGSAHALTLLRKEIDEAAKTADRPVISDAQAKELPYLQACIREAIRMWPPVTGLMAKVSHKDDVVCGIPVPAETSIAWDPIGMMRNKDLFGKDAELFEPGRWIEADEQRLKDMKSVQELAFAGGTRWECLGMRLAYTEMSKLIFEMFLHYDFTVVNPIKPFDWYNQNLTIVSNMDFQVTRRKW